MHRTTITLDDDLAAELEAYQARNGGQSRSEAIRDLIRRGLGQSISPPVAAECYGVVSYVVDQSVRNLAARLPQGRLDRHDQAVAALSVPLDHSHAVEVSVMRGAARDVSAYAEALFLERGVMHGALGLIPVARDTTWHVHNDGSSHAHSHLRVMASFKG